MCNKEALRGQFDLRQMDESVYRQHFLDEDHWNFFTEEPDIGPVLLSLKQEHDQFRYVLLCGVCASSMYCLIHESIEVCSAVPVLSACTVLVGSFVK